jgi:hypothetical protein
MMFSMPTAILTTNIKQITYLLYNKGQIKKKIDFAFARVTHANRRGLI